jgi:hypothetical protein
VLSFELSEGNTVLYVKNGQLVAARPPGGGRLESLLMKRGKVRPDIIPQLRLLLGAGRNIGDALIELQAISLTQLHAFVRGELRAILRDGLRLTDVDATFTDSPLSAQDHVRHEWDTGHAVVEGVRSQDLAFVRGLLPKGTAFIQRVSRTETLADALPLGPTERNLWNMLGTPQPWERLASIGLVSQPDQERALWVLLSAGLVRPLAANETPVEEEIVVEDDVDVSFEKDVSTEAIVFAEKDDAHEGPEDPESDPPSFSEVTVEQFRITAPQPTIHAAIAAAQEADEPVEETSRLELHTPSRSAASRRSPDDGDSDVSRLQYEDLLEEKRALERRLLQMLEQNATMISRELFEQLQTEKNELKGQLLSLVDEVIRLKSGGSFVPTGLMPAGSDRPNPFASQVSNEFEEGTVFTVKRSRT